MKTILYFFLLTLPSLSFGQERLTKINLGDLESWLPSHLEWITSDDAVESPAADEFYTQSQNTQSNYRSRRSLGRKIDPSSIRDPFFNLRPLNIPRSRQSIFKTTLRNGKMVFAERKKGTLNRLFRRQQ